MRMLCEERKEGVVIVKVLPLDDTHLGLFWTDLERLTVGTNDTFGEDYSVALLAGVDENHLGELLEARG